MLLLFVQGRAASWVVKTIGSAIVSWLVRRHLAWVDEPSCDLDRRVVLNYFSITSSLRTRLFLVLSCRLSLFGHLRRVWLVDKVEKSAITYLSLISISSTGKIALCLLRICWNLVYIASIRGRGVIHDLLDVRRNVTLSLRVHLTSLLLLFGRLRNRSLLVSDAQAVSTLMHLLGRLFAAKFFGLIGVRRRQNLVLVFRMTLRSFGVEFNLSLRFKTSTTQGVLLLLWMDCWGNSWVSMGAISHYHLRLSELHGVSAWSSTLTTVISTWCTLLSIPMSLDALRKIVTERQGSVIISPGLWKATCCSSWSIFSRRYSLSELKCRTHWDITRSQIFVRSTDISDYLLVESDQFKFR